MDTLTINFRWRDFNAVVMALVDGDEDAIAPYDHNLRGTHLYTRPDGRNVFKIEYNWHGQIVASAIGHKMPDIEESFIRGAEDGVIINIL